MPSPNIIREYVPESYYHVYNRGVEKRIIFHDTQDYAVFMSYMRRHLSSDNNLDSQNRSYKFFGSVELVAFCLMPNHFHLLFYQVESGTMSILMKSLLGSYTRYFNKRWKRSGPLFESRYKASLVQDETYLLHISRYIHMNPRYYQRYPYSSYMHYIGAPAADWLQASRIVDIFTDNRINYPQFCKEYETNKKLLEDIKNQLADT